MVSSALMNNYGTRKITLCKGDGSWVWDTDGKRYLDAVSGIAVCGLGHAHPAITEAFYSKTPLLVLTADRPTEWIDQADGQTIRQQNVFQNHVKKSYQLPSDYTHQDAKYFLVLKLNLLHKKFLLLKL